MVPTLAVVLPTRGLVHSRCVEAIQVAIERARGLVQVVPEWCFAHGLPIPQSHELAVDKAMATEADLFWFIEDDNVPPPDSLVASLAHMERTGNSMVAVDYPVGREGTRWDSVYREGGEVLFTGLGITLMHREVFEKLDKPWFDLRRWYGRVCNVCDRVRHSDRHRTIHPSQNCQCSPGTASRLSLIDEPYPPGVGGVDVAFSIRVREAGFDIGVVPRNERTSKPMVGAQIRTRVMGAESGSGVNDRPHLIEMWDTIDQPQYYFKAQDLDRFDKRGQWDDWVRVFRSMHPFKTKFWLGATAFGGDFDAMHDQRVVWARDMFPECNTVLELGSLEGGHTLAIAQWADEVTGVEGRSANLERARAVVELHKAGNVRLVQANLETQDLTQYGHFDLCFCVGVLYHMPDPLALLDRAHAAADNLFLWTHHAGEGGEKTYFEHGLDDPLSGLSPTSTWLPRSRLLAELAKRYGEVQVVQDEPDHHGAGPAITVACYAAKRTKQRTTRSKQLTSTRSEMQRG